jgi:hypothetical protein
MKWTTGYVHFCHRRNYEKIIKLNNRFHKDYGRNWKEYVERMGSDKIPQHKTTE